MCRNTASAILQNIFVKGPLFVEKFSILFLYPSVPAMQPLIPGTAPMWIPPCYK